MVNVFVIVLEELAIDGLTDGDSVGVLMGAADGASVQPLHVYRQRSYQFCWWQCPRLYAVTHVSLSKVSTARADLDSQSVGVEVGEIDGDVLGNRVGAMLGDVVGAPVGVVDGLAVGLDVGSRVGSRVGLAVGLAVGPTVGNLVGILEGDDVGDVVGATVQSVHVYWHTLYQVARSQYPNA